eukprot:TRINITY_DN29205_c0_g1_i2.p1 TRINITY_DN29205_c0_g1~~TRINITY_DN29205_c0_g1_i2.p1  ORF type:complete len:402 (+),score=43.86 TRINITY_DN29205_c0_g1_i2:386-1591(+)
MPTFLFYGCLRSSPTLPPASRARCGRGSPLQVVPLHSWERATPEIVGGPPNQHFSAVCYHFGKRVLGYANTVTPGVAVGLIAASYDGAFLQAFAPPAALHKCPEPYRAQSALPSQVWNAMLAPLRLLALKGVLIYQGERNARLNQALLYQCLFPAVIEQWRKHFPPDLPVVFVQLSAHAGFVEGDLSRLRYAQTAALLLPRVGMAVALDSADRQPGASAAYYQLHPRFKQRIGERAADAMFAQAYDDTRFRFPYLEVDKVSLDDSGDGRFAARVTFLGVDGNLRLAGTRDCTVCCQTAPFRFVVGDHFQLATEFALTEDSSAVEVKVSLPRQTPQALQFLWENIPQCTLYDDTDRTAAPFHYSFESSTPKAFDPSALEARHRLLVKPDREKRRLLPFRGEP